MVSWPFLFYRVNLDLERPSTLPFVFNLSERSRNSSCPVCVCVSVYVFVDYAFTCTLKPALRMRDAMASSSSAVTFWRFSAGVLRSML